MTSDEVLIAARSIVAAKAKLCEHGQSICFKLISLATENELLRQSWDLQPDTKIISAGPNELLIETRTGDRRRVSMACPAEFDRLAAELAEARTAFEAYKEAVELAKNAGSNRCYGCWLMGEGVNLTKIHLTNGCLRLCQICLDDFNRKNPELAEAKAALDKFLEENRVQHCLRCNKVYMRSKTVSSECCGCAMMPVVASDVLEKWQAKI